MKSQNWWFISFYILLSTFIIYELVFLIFLSKNDALKELYDHGFIFEPVGSNFNRSSYALVFVLPVIGLAMSCLALVSCIFTSRIFLERTPKFKLCFLILNFMIFIIGFLLSFAGELFYSEWNNPNVIIQSNQGFVERANYYYQNWLSSTVIWSIFGLYFALLVGCVILVVKLNLINIQAYNFYHQRKTEEQFEPELKQPLPSSNQFDPYDTQTITIFLDDEEDSKKTKQKEKS